MFCGAEGQQAPSSRRGSHSLTEKTQRGSPATSASVAKPGHASGLHFSTIRFVYTGLYWVQLGAAAIDAPL